MLVFKSMILVWLVLDAEQLLPLGTLHSQQAGNSF